MSGLCFGAQVCNFWHYLLKLPHQESLSCWRLQPTEVLPQTAKHYLWVSLHIPRPAILGEKKLG